MVYQQNQSLQVGDWVSGTSVQDERFRGYIESIDAPSGLVAVRMIETDHEQARGWVTKAYRQQVKAIPDKPLECEGHLLNLIDIALTSKDKEWFQQLTTKLLVIQKQPHGKKSNQLTIAIGPRWT